MNMKEAFRFQNKIQSLMDTAESILLRDGNVTTTKNTYLRSKVMPEAQDETVVDTPDCEYADNITGVVGFLMFLLDEKERLSGAILDAKNELEFDFDGETSLNVARHRVACLLKRMSDLRGSEVTLQNAGVGYRFNVEGNQVAYKCDVRKVVDINFDREVVRKHLSALNEKADAVSAELDKCLVNTEVPYEAPFDVNDSFADVFEKYQEQAAKEKSSHNRLLRVRQGKERTESGSGADEL